MEPDSETKKEIENSPLLAELSDDALLRHWKSGDEAAAEILSERYTLRLVALVASRLNRRYIGTVEPEDVVQSAMASFFHAARHSRIEVSSNLSMWRLLATFARRKMARSIESRSAHKRGGRQERVSLDAAEALWADKSTADHNSEATELIESLRIDLTSELWDVCERLLAGQMQSEIAEALSIDERTVRRRVVAIRQAIAGATADPVSPNAATYASSVLPQIDYRHFVLGKLIGSGGFGKLYRARLQSDGSIVAVKFLRKAFWQNSNARQTFLREIESASLIEHPGVVRYLGWGLSPHGGPYVVSHWVDGNSLHQLGGVEPVRFMIILRQVCEAMEAIHRVGLVHGDLTPSNILVDRNDRVTIIDFGFSQRSVRSSHSGENAFLGGTIGYAAPEQISSAFGAISPKTDIYAVGGLIYWFLTGRPPHHNNRMEDAIEDTIAPISLDVTSFSKSSPVLYKILTSTLRKSPKERELAESDLQTLPALPL